MAGLTFETNPFRAFASRFPDDIARALAEVVVAAASPAEVLSSALAEHLGAPAFERWHGGLWEPDRELRGDLAGLQRAAREYLGDQSP